MTLKILLELLFLDGVICPITYLICIFRIIYSSGLYAILSYFGRPFSIYLEFSHFLWTNDWTPQNDIYAVAAGELQSLIVYGMWRITVFFIGVIT